MGDKAAIERSTTGCLVLLSAFPPPCRGGEAERPTAKARSSCQRWPRIPKPVDPTWFRDAKSGLFVHYGLPSIPAGAVTPGVSALG